jgi:hypothetical protein
MHMYICRWGIVPVHVFPVLQRKLCCAVISGNGSLNGGESIHSWVLFPLVQKWSWREPSLKKVAEQFRERFNKTAPSNTVMLSTIMKFHHSGSVLCEWKGRSGWLVTVSIKENYAHVLQQVLHLPARSLWCMALKLNVSDTSIRWSFKDIGGE